MNNNEINVDKLIKISYEIKESLKKQKTYISSFHHSDGGFFFRKEEEHSNLTSTITCTNSLIDADIDDFIDKEKIYNDIITRKNWTSAQLPEDNHYTVPILLYGLQKLRKYNFKEGKIPERIIYYLEIIKSVIQSEGGLNVLDYPKNTYLTFWGIMSYEAYYGRDSTNKDLKKGIEWLENELYHQIALFHSEYEIEKDIFQLGYAITILVRFKQNILNPVFKKAIDIIFQDQKDDGSWEKYHPLFHYPEVGNAYCYIFELLSNLFLIPEPYYSLLGNYIKNFERIRQWANIYEFSEQTEEGTYGWCSYHYADWRKPESWATANTFDFLQLYKALIDSIIKKKVLTKFEAKTYSENYWDEKMLDVQLFIKRRETSLKKLLEEFIINPIKQEKERKAYGIMFFGPPGTGKTLYAKAIAQRLGWPLIILDPSHFLLEGFSGVVRTAKRIFHKLQYLENVVVLFDEMDELMRERSLKFEYETRFFTASMLPLISTLHEKEDFIYIFNTNIFKEIDPAIKRPARFDFQLFIGPPIYDEKKKIIKKELEKEKMEIEKIELIIRTVDEKKNRDKLELFLYHEILNLCSEFLNLDTSLSNEDYFKKIQLCILEAYNSTYIIKKDLLCEFQKEKNESIINRRK
ncbi:hypothetical protein LCGC14_1142090 [marine sediment metagenome]|uniref:AAA+ ATPase domain-containing protein n=1 Tax=marine sediment metagenome TaxID=412755 RepID=A0A0F9M2S6_9ZZZZ